MPIALANSIDALGPVFEAIVVDEGQDFGDEFWMPIEMLLTSLDQGDERHIAAMTLPDVPVDQPLLLRPHGDHVLEIAPPRVDPDAVG
jgi:hypothetical protein